MNSSFVQKLSGLYDKVIKWFELEKLNKGNNTFNGLLKQLLLMLVLAHVWFFFSNCYGILILYFPKLTGYFFLLSIVTAILIIVLFPLWIFLDAMTSKQIIPRLQKLGLFSCISCLVICFLIFPFKTDGPIIPISTFIQNHLITEKSEFPLSESGGIAVDKEGALYVSLHKYGRVQVYSNAGEFVRGWNIDAAGGAFDIWFEDNELHVLTSRTDRHEIYNTIGKLLSFEMVNAYEDKEKLWSKADGLATFDSKGAYYEIKNPSWKPKVIKREPRSSEISILIQDPIYIWIHQSPLPVWLIGLINILFTWLLSLIKKIV